MRQTASLKYAMTKSLNHKAQKIRNDPFRHHKPRLKQNKVSVASNGETFQQLAKYIAIAVIIIRITPTSGQCHQFE